MSDSTFLLLTRVDLLRAFFQLTGGTDDDDALTEHDAETLEQAYYYLTHGVWEAQRWALDHGWSDWWITYDTTSLAAISGSDTSHGGRYATLPSNFLRLAGDCDLSPIRSTDGRMWGELVEDEGRLDGLRGACFAVRGSRLAFARGATTLPSGAALRYHARHADLAADDTAIDFPIQFRPLIPAEAAWMAMDDGWSGIRQQQYPVIERSVSKWRARMAAHRRSAEPRTFDGPVAWNGRV